MMDLALEETVELISFTQGKQFKYVFINANTASVLIKDWSRTDVSDEPTESDLLW